MRGRTITDGLFGVYSLGIELTKLVALIARQPALQELQVTFDVVGGVLLEEWGVGEVSP